MKFLFRISVVSAVLLLLIALAVEQDRISASAAVYLVFFVGFAALAIWIFFRVFSNASTQKENLVACPTCSMRTDSQREACMWCDQGLPGS
jgi:hypothetical protein